MTPDEELADQIASVLIENGLVDPSKALELKAKIATGTANEQDWRLWVELSPIVTKGESRNAAPR